MTGLRHRPRHCACCAVIERWEAATGGLDPTLIARALTRFVYPGAPYPELTTEEWLALRNATYVIAEAGVDWP